MIEIIRGKREVNGRSCRSWKGKRTLRWVSQEVKISGPSKSFLIKVFRSVHSGPNIESLAWGSGALNIRKSYCSRIQQ